MDMLKMIFCGNWHQTGYVCVDLQQRAAVCEWDQCSVWAVCDWPSCWWCHCGPRSEPWVWTRGRRGPQTNACSAIRAQQHTSHEPCSTASGLHTRSREMQTSEHAHSHTFCAFKGTVHTKIKFMLFWCSSFYFLPLNTTSDVLWKSLL